MSTFHLANKADFGKEFQWGIASSAYQIEGAYQADGKGKSIWDDFTNRKQKARNKSTANEATHFYYHYEQDLDLIQSLNFRNFRYSISWSRIFPEGNGKVNQKGLDFYNRLIDACLERGIQPWFTLYHWDLPLALEQKGGWTNRAIVDWFLGYVETCVKYFGDRVKQWMVMNEPNVFTGAGYGLGMHAPGRFGMGNFLSALHHALVAQGSAAKLIKSLDNQARVGSTFSVTPIDPYSDAEKDKKAALRIHALVNRLCVEPLLGHGYPFETLPFLKKINRYLKEGDEEKIAFDPDFIGIQPYTREVVKNAFFIPFIRAWRLNPKKRKVALTAMGWENYPHSVFRALTWIYGYSNCPDLYITENGIALFDRVNEEKIADYSRIRFYREALKSALKARQAGVPLKGYFAWTFTDNFEWAEGYEPRFGMVHVDFDNQKRTLKASARWFKAFLEGESAID